MQANKRIIEKYRKGDSMSTKELKLLQGYYHDLHRLLMEAGEIYQLVEVDVYRQLQRVNEYLDARAKK